MYSNYNNMMSMSYEIDSSSIMSSKDFIEKDVAVIGAGCAGLECASKLYTYGFKNIVVLEAQDYIGGRIKTIYLNNDECYPLEMGANWIHGLWGNPLTKLIKEYPSLFQHKKKKLFSEDNVYFADENGKSYDSLMCRSFYELYNKWNAESKLIWIQNKNTNFKSYTDYMVNKLEKHIENDLDEVKRIKRALLERLLKFETVESGCTSMDLLSVNEYGSYDKPAGPDYEFPGGYSKLIEFLADKLPKSAIKLNHAVKNISVSKTRTQLVNNSLNPEESNLMIVECFNGTLFKAKHVVLTCSVNFLQKNYTTLFTSNLLSEKKIDAINTAKMDTVDKIFLFYDDLSLFFPDSIDSIHPIYLKENNKNDQKDDWFYKTFTFDRFYDNMLLVWISGKEAKHIEKLSDDEISITLTNVLRRLLSNNNIPMPNKIIKTKWNSNPYILGSYSYIGINGSTKHITNLAEPIYIDKIPRLLFAGEATHTRYYSTVHGAYLSGQREAKRLHDFYQVEK